MNQAPLENKKASDNTNNHKFEATFNILIMSIASTAAMALGLTNDPQTGTKTVDLNMAKFNIDLLLLLQDKTKGHLSPEENQILQSTITDLQSKLSKLK